jgi:ATP-dependent DNA helicase DinG
MHSLHDDIERVFGPDGILPALSGFEHRPQQEEMAHAVADALMNGTHLVVEAPTGIGKSLAYLVPAILHAARNKKKAVIATHTKNLQEQLWRKDLPIATQLIAREPSSASLLGSAAILKGRRNYLCSTRLQNALRQPKLIFDGDRSDILQRVASWANTTVDGDLENAPFPIPIDVASRICSEHGTCSTKLCGSSCYFQRAKQRARDAQIVIANHALFFTLLVMRPNEEYFLFPDDFVIFDEAHLLEQSATHGIGRNLTKHQILFAIHRLYNPRTKKGLLSRQRSGDFKHKCESAENAAVSFFDAIASASRSLQPKSSAVWWKTALPVDNSLGPHLKELQHLLTELGEKKTVRIPKEELDSAKRLLAESDLLVSEFLRHGNESMTYWVEIPPGKTPNVSIQIAPTSVAESVGPLLFRPGIPVVLTSATLAVNDGLSYYQHRVGAHHAKAITLGSPFNFRKQMRVSIDAEMPQPDAPSYEEALPDAIMRAVRRTHGRSLVLFTNSWLMRRMADQLAPHLLEDGITLLVQQSGASRHELLEHFKADVDSVLFGLDSFWMGVDVPGEALQHVIITRLPFAVPDHPLVQARMEEIEKRGEQPFFAYSLPEAILKLRQGVGRLIRRSDDTGIVTILDSRIVGKNYGRMFLESLPRCTIELIRGTGEVEEIILDESFPGHLT